MPSTYRQEARSLIILALPLALAQMVQAGMTFVDTVMVARLGSAALAGIALGATGYMLVTIFLQGTVFAVGPLVSQAFGGDRIEEAGRVARQGMWLALLLGLPALALLLNAERLLLAIGQEPAAAELAASYLSTASWGIIPALLLVALRAFFEGTGDTRPILYLMIVGLAANALLDELLMFGRLGLPELGVAGTGLATSFVHLLMFLLAALLVVRRHARFEVFARPWQPDRSLLTELWRLGMPIGLTVGFEAGLFAATALLMGLVGQVELAAHQIAIQIATMTFMLAVGLSVATSVRVGQALGRGDPDGARLAGRVGISLAAATMTLNALLFWLAPELVIGIFLDTNAPENALVVRFAITFLAVAATFQIFDGIQVSAAGALRGYKDTTVPMVISLVSYWCVGISSGAYLAFGLGWGGRGLWIGLVLGLMTAALLLLARFTWRSRWATRAQGRMVAVLGRRS
ncbi:MAG TPA: MATE family efflux transporter [Trueperaceae bacterium]